MRELLGYLGTAVVIIAYLPQVFHLIKEHCSAGISIKAYAMWSVSGLLILIHAFSIKAPVFTTLQSYQLGVCALIIFLANKYKHRVCDMWRSDAKQHASRYRIL